MPLRYVLDEQLRGPLWAALRQHNASGSYSVDVVRVGDPPDLPLGSNDPAILIWAEREGRIVVTEDRKTMRTHLANHVQAGHHSPGVCLLPPGRSLPNLVFSLVLAAYASDPAEWLDQERYLP
jgi:hypothetical protein